MKARLVFIGTDHDDLGGPVRLPRVVRHFLAERPAFAAVEWPEIAYRALSARRSAAYDHIVARLPDVPDPLRRALANTLAYEPDAVAGLDLPIIWLTDGHEDSIVSDPGAKVTVNAHWKADNLLRHLAMVAGDYKRETIKG